MILGGISSKNSSTGSFLLLLPWLWLLLLLLLQLLLLFATRLVDVQSLADAVQVSLHLPMKNSFNLGTE
jgi:glycerol-3-phosphate acyltransferase PlsY